MSILMVLRWTGREVDETLGGKEMDLLDHIYCH